MLSQQVREILSQYPQWQVAVNKAMNKQPLVNYTPMVIEVFDQAGLLAGMAWGIFYETHRDEEQPSEFMAWYYDGQLAFFQVEAEIVVNRLPSWDASL